MRYRPRWSNGFWQVFDSHRFDNVERCYLETGAIEAAAAWNAKQQ
jgi:hypothetical protein